MSIRMSMKAIWWAMLAVCACMVCACGNAAEQTHTEQVKQHQKKVVAPKKKTVHVYFFDGFKDALGKNTIKELDEVFDSVEFEGVIPYPDSAYYAPRNRYKADKLVRHIKALQKGTSDLEIGFASKDISAAVHGHDDFGIMGWTRISLKTAVVSTFRVKGANAQNRDFFKLVIHELGHTEGLQHCKNSRTCYMRDAKGTYHLHELTDFCPTCKAHLIKRGWHLR